MANVINPKSTNPKFQNLSWFAKRIFVHWWGDYCLKHRNFFVLFLFQKKVLIEDNDNLGQVIMF